MIVDREIGAVATDTWGVEVRVNGTEAVNQPLDVILLLNPGLVFGEMFDLEPRAEACADDGSHEFMFVAPPVLFGGPMNLVAIK